MKRFVRASLWGLLGFVALLAVGVAIGNIAVSRTETTGLEAAPGRFVDLSEAAIHYQRVGDPDGPTMVFVHGFGVEGGAVFADLTTQLADRFDLVVVDLVGFGHSARPREAGDSLTHRGRAATLASFAEQLGLQDATWVGASYGGGIAVELAVRRPDLVDRLVIIDGQLSDLGGGVFQTLGAAPLGIGRAASFLALTGGPVAEAFAQPTCSSACPIRGDLAHRESIVSIDGTTDGFVHMSRTDLDTSLPGSLAQLTVPTQLIWGEADELIPIEVGRQHAEVIPGAMFTVVAGAGHSPHVDDPMAVAEAIAQFVEPSR